MCFDMLVNNLVSKTVTESVNNLPLYVCQYSLNNSFLSRDLYHDGNE